MLKAHFKTEGATGNRYIKVNLTTGDGKKYSIIITQRWLDADVDEHQELGEDNAKSNNM